MTTMTTAGIPRSKRKSRLMRDQKLKNKRLAERGRSLVLFDNPLKVDFVDRCVGDVFFTPVCDLAYNIVLICGTRSATAGVDFVIAVNQIFPLRKA